MIQHAPSHLHLHPTVIAAGRAVHGWHGVRVKQRGCWIVRWKVHTRVSANAMDQAGYPGVSLEQKWRGEWEMFGGFVKGRERVFWVCVVGLMLVRRAC